MRKFPKPDFTTDPLAEYGDGGGFPERPPAPPEEAAKPAPEPEPEGDAE